MKIEHHGEFLGGYQLKTFDAVNTPLADKVAASVADKYGVHLKYGTENASSLNLSTRMYADNVIKNALKNIESGENIADNRRRIQIFGSIINESPQKIIYG